MMKRFLEIYEDIKILALKKELNDYDGSMIMPQHIPKITTSVNILQIVEKFSRRCEGEKYLTLSSVPPLLYNVMESLKPNPHDSSFVGDLKDSPTTCMENRLGFILKK